MATWELFDGEKTVGPCPEEDVLEAIRRGGLNPAIMVREAGSGGEWRPIRTHAPFAMLLERRSAGGITPAAPSTPPPQIAQRVRKSEFFGTGCVIQGLGFIAPFVGAVAGPVGFVLGLLVLLALLLVGRQLAIFWTCGACGNRLSGDGVTVCPTCRAQLKA